MRKSTKNIEERIKALSSIISENNNNKLITPPLPWSLTENARDNFSGLSIFNSIEFKTSLVNHHWKNEHNINSESYTSIELINYLQDTPFYLNQNAFNYYFTKENPLYIDNQTFKEKYQAFKKIKKALDDATGVAILEL